MIYILYLDDFHLGDPMFLRRLGRGIGRSGLKLAVVHSSKEIIEREMESLGIFPSGNDQSMEDLSDQEAVSAIIRACKDQNRTITHELNEAGVSAVPMDATSRGLLTGDDLEGFRIGRMDWFTELVQSGGVPVIAPLAEVQGRTGMIDTVGLVQLLVQTLSDSSALLMPRKSSPSENPALEDLSDVEAAKILLEAGLRVAAAFPGMDGVKPLEIAFST